MLYDYTRGIYFPSNGTSPEELEAHAAPWTLQVADDMAAGVCPRRPAPPETLEKISALAYCPPGEKIDDYQMRAASYIMSGDDTFLTALPGLGKTIMAITAMNLMIKTHINEHRAGFGWKTMPYFLIICPKVVLTNWVSELKKWLDPHPWGTPPIQPRIPDTNLVSHGSHRIGIATTKYWPKTANIVLINYDIVDKLRDKIDSHVPGSQCVVVDGKEHPPWATVIVDECHYLKSPKAIRTKAVLGDLGDAKATSKKKKLAPIMGRRRVFMTGTPLNRPIDIWPIIRTISGPFPHAAHTRAQCAVGRFKPIGDDWFAFVRRYCNAAKTRFGWDVNGASNLNELGQVLAEQGMYRQDETVLNLPDYMEQTVVFQTDEEFLSAEQELVQNALNAMFADTDNPVNKRAIDDLQTRLKKLDPARYSGVELRELGDISGGGVAYMLVGESLAEHAVGLAAPLSAILFTEYSRIRALVGEAKARAAIPYILHLLEEELDKEDPLLIFAYHKNVIRQIHEAVEEKYGSGTSAVITGETSTDERGLIVADFQSGRRRVIVANLLAGGVGVTLTRANRCVVVESDWRATTVDQAIKRIHRRTQTRPCTTDYIVMEGTLDTHVINGMLRKRKTAATVNDEVGARNA